MQIDNGTADAGSPRREWQSPEAPWAPYLITLSSAQSGQVQYDKLLKHTDNSPSQIIPMITTAVIITMAN